MKCFSLVLKLSFGLLFLALTSSCTTTKPLTSAVKPDEVKDILYLEPSAYISLIKSGNRGFYNDSLSWVSRQLQSRVLSHFKPQIPINEQFAVRDTGLKRKLEKEVEYLCFIADRNRSLSGLKITPILDSVLELNHKRFGLITIGSGFTRAKGNYSGEVAKGAAIGLLTLGMYYQTPIKSRSTVYAMIVDSKDNNVAFFRKSFLQDREPLDEATLMKQFQDIFNGYFLKAK